jgi:methylmalonyl-CoA/ethylmalonyl-CoA epimerase
MKIMRLDHVGLTVKNIEQVIETLERVLGVKAFACDASEEDRVKRGHLPLGNTTLQLLEHWGEAPGPVGQHFRDQGPGSPHIAVEVENIREEIDKLRAANIPMLSDSPQPGTRGTLTAFIHPSATKGLLTELVEHPKARS